MKEAQADYTVSWLDCIPSIPVVPRGMRSKLLQYP